jgi:hypothetical protein
MCNNNTNLISNIVDYPRKYLAERCNIAIHLVELSICQDRQEKHFSYHNKDT